MHMDIEKIIHRFRRFTQFGRGGEPCPTSPNLRNLRIPKPLGYRSLMAPLQSAGSATQSRLSAGAIATSLAAFPVVLDRRSKSRYKRYIPVGDRRTAGGIVVWDGLTSNPGGLAV